MGADITTQIYPAYDPSHRRVVCYDFIKMELYLKKTKCLLSICEVQSTVPETGGRQRMENTKQAGYGSHLSAAQF